MVVSVEEVPVTKETECEKSNGDSDQTTDKLSVEKSKEVEENVIANGIKPTAEEVADEIITESDIIDSKLDKSEKSKTNNDNESENEKTEVADGSEIPPLPLSNGISHETNDGKIADETIENNQEVCEPVEEPEEPLSEPSKENETSAMEVDENVVEEPMETTTTPETDELEPKPKETEDESEAAEQAAAEETPKKEEESASTQDDNKVEETVTAESEDSELTERKQEELPIEEQLTQLVMPVEEQPTQPMVPVEEQPTQPVVPVEEQLTQPPTSSAAREDDAPSPAPKTCEQEVCEPLPEKANDEEETPEVKKPVATPSETKCDKKDESNDKTKTKAEERMDVDKEEKSRKEIPSSGSELRIKEEPAVVTIMSRSATPTAAAISETSSVLSDTVVTTATTTIPTPNSVSKSVAATVVGTKRRADTATEELETDRDGRISSSSCGSGSGSDAENNQDCKRIRFDESIFEEDERERQIRENVEQAGECPEEISKNCNKLQDEITSLSNLARAKELEWNSIIRLLKLKEEILERILFKKRYLDCQAKVEPDANLSKLYKTITAGAASSEQIKASRNESNIPTCINSQVTVVPISSSAVSMAGLSNANAQELYKGNSPATNLTESSNKLRSHRPILPKPAPSSVLPQSPAQQPQSTMAAVQPTSHALPLQTHAPQQVTQALSQSIANSLLVDQNSVVGEGRQGPFKDVKSVIAEHRAKNPESGPRRGRRNIQFSARAPDAMNVPRFMPNNPLLSMSNMALCSGSQVRTNVSSTTHNDHRPGNFFLGQDSPLSAALNRPDLQIRQANMDSFMLSINAANSSSSSQSNTNNAIASNANSGSSVSIVAAANANAGVGGMAGAGSSNSFQEALVKFAKKNDKRDMSNLSNAALHISSTKNASHLPPPPPYPEVTLHPLAGQIPTPQNSLLHDILTAKSGSGPNRGGSGSGSGDHHASSSMGGIATNLSASSVSNIQHRPTTFSPTLARLLIAPERNRSSRSNFGTSTRNTKSTLSEILNSKKTRTEVTITPVTTSTSCATKNGSEVLMVDDDDESENTDRLVIDEGREAVADPTSNAIPVDQLPECQGCHKKAAQFVCAGCGNQWYCSRDCQVEAWDEHSEMCSG